MDIIGIGIWEVIVILVIAMLVVGPRRLPETAIKLGQMVRKFRMTTTELTRSITAEVEEESKEIKANSINLKRELDSISKEMKPDPEEHPTKKNGC